MANMLIVVRKGGCSICLAYDLAMKYLHDGVAEAGAWTRASFDGRQDLQSVRDSTVLLRESVRLVGHEPGVGSRARCA